MLDKPSAICLKLETVASSHLRNETLCAVSISTALVASHAHFDGG